jgi:hypothetical protein
MHVEVKQHHVSVPRSLIENIHLHVPAELKRFEHLIRRVCVRIAEVNGSRGGKAKSCRIQIDLRRASSVIINDRGVSLLAVIACAVARVDAAVSRAGDRSAGRRRCSAKGTA